MKVGNILSFSFTSLSWIVFMLFFTDRGQDLTWHRCMVTVICGLFFGLLFTLSMNRMAKRSHQKLLAFDEIDLGEEIRQKSCMNHLRGIIADGGYGFLLHNKLVFMPHRLNSSRKTLTIPFSDVACVSDYKIWGLVNAGLKVTLTSGKVEKFVIDKSDDFYRELKGILR